MAEVVGSGVISFFSSRWRGDVPLATVFWRDMILIGTAINVLAAFVALMLLALDMSRTTALAVFFSPLPWNLFLVLAVWRGGDKATASEAFMTRLGAAIWFALALII